MRSGPEVNGTYLGQQPNQASLTSNNVRRKPMTQETASRVVFFHLETTGFGHDAEIIQITASCYGQTFNAYLLPEGEIHPKAMEKNGFLKSGDWVFLRGQPVYTTGRWLAANKFLAFLRGVGGNAVLAAHNASAFHAPLLATFLNSLGFTKQFELQLQGLTDTLPLFRKALQGRAAAGKSFTLEDLSKDLLGELHVHDAEQTVATLENLIKAAGISYEEIAASAKPLGKFST